MAKNDQIFNYLNAFDALQTKDSTACRNALEALIAVDPGDATAFRKAIWDKKTFWELFNPGLFKVPEQSTLSSLFKSKPAMDVYANSDDFLDPTIDSDEEHSFNGIQRIAVEQRIKLGLKNASDEILIKILKHNEEELRDYLATKQHDDLIALNKIPGWQNHKEDILADDAIDNIKLTAFELLLQHKISNSADLKLLTDIKKANDLPSLKGAIEKLGIEKALVDQFIRNQDLSESCSDLFEERLKALQVNQAKTQYIETINQTTAVPEILKFNSMLEADDFQSELPHQLSQLEDNDVNEIQARMGLKYLQAYLPQISDTADTAKLMEAINTEGPEQLIKKIKELAGDHSYIELAVTQDNLKHIKKSLFEGYIRHYAFIDPQTNVIDLNKTIGILKNLAGASDLSQFKKTMGQLAIKNPEEVISQKDFDSIRKTACMNAFQRLVDQYSRFGHELHSHLIDAFSKLSLDKQRELIANPNTVNHLLNAKHTKTIEHYFGAGAVGVTEVIDENTRLGQFGKIHNRAVASILSHWVKPPAILNDKQIEGINAAFVTDNTPKKYQEIDISSPANYKVFVDKIKSQCPAISEKDFYNAFGLNDNGSAFQGNGAVRTQIKTQNENNQFLLNVYYEPLNEGYQKLFDVFLRLNKDSKLDLQNCQLIYKAFNQQADVQKFIDDVAPSTSSKVEIRQLRRQLLKELTPSVYNELRSEINIHRLKAGNSQVASSIIKEIDDELTKLIENRKKFDQVGINLEKLKDINPIHLLNPAFQSKASSESAAMKETYQQLAKDCALIIDQLEREKNRLYQLEKILKQTEQDDELLVDVTSELLIVKSDLEFYNKIQEKLEGPTGIIKAIDQIATKEYVLIAKPADVKVQTMTVDELGRSTPIYTAPNTNSKIKAASVDSPLFELVDKLPEGQVRVYDYSTNNMVARFTEKRSSESYYAVVDDKVSNQPIEEFEILKFPEMPQTVAQGQKKPSPEEVMDAKVIFSLKVAAQTLASLEKPPTKDNPLVLEGVKEDELKHLYTALVILGKNTPDMYFDASAIKVKSMHFDPKKEMGTLWGFNKTSLYETVYKDHPAVKEWVNGLGKVTDVKFGHEKEIKQVDEAVKQVTKLFKKDLNKAKQKIETTIEKEGPAFKK